MWLLKKYQPLFKLLAVFKKQKFKNLSNSLLIFYIKKIKYEKY